MAVCIHFGLLEAARRNPLPLDDAHVPQLIRGALFSSDPIDQPSPELVECVTERLLSAIHQHLDDDSQAFDKWFLGPKNSVVHQLAKQKHSRGGELLEEDVRHALLHLGWQAYEFAANSIHAQMRTFQNAMPEPLADREKLLFEHMHLRQPYLGNFPSVLLAPRFGLIKGLLWELWEKAPDLTLAPIFYRLLDFYSTMATRRRAADRRIKRPRSVQFDERFHSPSPKQHQFQEIAGVIREMQKIDCGCPRRVWWAELKGQGKATVCIVHRCMACEFEMETTMRWEEFSSIARASL